MNDGTAEARAAARWWAHQFRGDLDKAPIVVDGRIIEVTASPTAQEVARFWQCLETTLLELIRSPGWAWPQPRAERMKGDERPFRCLCTGWSEVDDVLRAALAAAGFSTPGMTLLPLHTTMWIDPGAVTFTTGDSFAVQMVALDV
ncbi:hypothetical protein ACFXG4_23765 [Nocardia sp. NPDC059246]|uniref:hypothetical protein n=1 Tax=unclassified Nocardia TaxID=2637762 RepID=UPI0036CB919C